MRKLLLTAVLLFTATCSLLAEDEDSLYAKDIIKAGETAPAFTMKSNKGKDISLKQFLDKGKYVIIDFWATWCPDCRKDVPKIKEIYEKYKGYNLEVVSVSFDTDATTWNNFTGKNGMEWNQVSELKKWKRGTEIDRLYHINWIPTMYLIAPDGKVVLSTVMSDKLGSTLSSLEKEGKIKK